MNIYSIRWRLMATMLSLVIALLVTVTYVQIRSQHEILTNELTTRAKLMRETTILRGETISNNIGNQVAMELAAFNLSGISELVHTAVNKNSDMVYGILMTLDRMVLIHTLKPELEQGLETLTDENMFLGEEEQFVDEEEDDFLFTGEELLFTDEDTFAFEEEMIDEALKPEIQDNKLLGKEVDFAIAQEHQTQHFFKKGDEEIVEFIIPIPISVEQGVLRLGFSLAQVTAKIAQSHKEIEEQIHGMVVQSIITAVIFLVFALIIVFIIAEKISKPIVELTQSARELAQGNFSAKIPVRVDCQDEVNILATTFANMAKNLKESYHVLENKNAELQQLNKLKDEFLANTSHELRTPLNGIIGIAESLIDGVTGELGEKTKQNLVMIVGSGKRLSTLVNDILDFSKLKGKTLELQLKPVGLREIVELVLNLSQPLIAKKEIQLINAIVPELKAAYADENRLQQILYNLIGNAIKFTESGRIEISAQMLEDHLEIKVSDTGIGISKDKFDRIFKSFEQAEGSTAREYGGTGLGLAVSKKLVNLHGGKIWLESQVDVGSQFFFTIPVSDEQVSSSVVNSSLSRIQAPIEVPSEIETEKKTSDQFTILIVDDEEVNLQVLKNYLYLQNYHIVPANSGIQALKIIEEGLQPDAILLDVMMPQMTGYEVTQKLRETWQADELPILLLTAKNQITDLVTGLEVGANDYLSKPFSKDELLARLKTHINIKRLKAENMRMTAELDVTRRIQKMLLPKEQELEQVPGLEMAGFMEPAEEVGGDYYDVLQYNGRILIGIGDATGHGLESGMLALMTQAAVRTLLESGEMDLTKFLNSLNGMIYKNVQERLGVDKNLTLSLLEYKPTGILQITGQHEDMIVVRNGNLEVIETMELGFSIGLVDDISAYVAQIEVRLNKGDVVLLCTDGITEAVNPEQSEYGINRLSEIVKTHWKKTPKEIQQAVIDDVRQFIGTQKVYDDMTLLVLKQK